MKLRFEQFNDSELYILKRALTRISSLRSPSHDSRGLNTSSNET